MEELSIFEKYPAIQIALYIVTAIIGGVVYKYWDRWLGHKSESTQIKLDANQRLIENLQNRIDNITEALDRQEEERVSAHERELERTKTLAKSEAKVEILQNRIKQLEERLEMFSSLIEKYRDKYGPISDLDE